MNPTEEAGAWHPESLAGPGCNKEAHGLVGPAGPVAAAAAASASAADLDGHAAAVGPDSAHV